MNEKRDLSTERLGRLMLRFSLPCVISLLVGALYNIVDQIFIANAEYLGSYGNAANTAVFPLTVIALAVAVMIGDGCCALISIALGSRDGRVVSKTFGASVTLTVLSGVVISALYLLFSRQLIVVFGGSVNAKTYEFAKEYFTWISLGIPFYVFGQGMNPVIRADGSPKYAMACTLTGAAVNLILDPVFIFPLKMGMTGAAVATVAGQAVTAVMTLSYLFRLKSAKLDKNAFIPEAGVIRRALSLGVCSFLSQISLVAAMAAINNMVKKYGALDPVFGIEEYAQIPMAVVGIVMKFFQIIISVSVGAAAGCIPVVGFNMGAKREDRVRSLFTRLLICEAAVGAVAVIAAECFPTALINIFGAKNESVYYTQFAQRAFRIYLSTAILACVNKASFIFLQAMGRALASTLLSVVREIVFGVGLALLLPLFFGLDGVLISMPAADILTAFLSAFIVAATYRQLSRKKENG